MLDLGHLGHQIGDLHESGIGPATGGDDVLLAGAVGESVDDVVDVDPAPVDWVGEFVEEIEVMLFGVDAPLDFEPALLGVGGVIFLGAGLAGPRPARTHFVPFDGAALAGFGMEFVEAFEHRFLADLPLGGFDELEDTDVPALVPAAQGETKGGC